MNLLSIQCVGANSEEQLDSLIQAELLIALAGKKSNEPWNRWFQRDYFNNTFRHLAHILIYEHAEYAYHLHDGASQTRVKANELDKIEAWLNSH